MIGIAQSDFAVADAGPPIFSSLEWSVIAIGRREQPGWFEPDSFPDKIQRLLFGIQSPRPFADRRLEALRRLAFAMTRPGRNPDAEIAVAVEAGLTPEQIGHLRSPN